MVVTLFKGSPVAVREQIADELGVSTKVLDSWLVTINTVRNYRDGRSSDIGTISQCWEVDPNVYSSDSARPWHSSHMQVKRAVFDSDFANAGMTNFAYFFHSVMSMTEVAGFQRLAGLANVSHMFTSCNRLETIWATSFDHTTITRRPARWTAAGGSWGRRVSWPPTAPGRPPSRSGPAASSPTPLRTSAWAWGHLYDTGALEISASTTPDAGRTVVATGRVCTNAHYLTAMAMPWYDGRASLTSCAFLSDLAGSTIASIDYWFYSMTTLVSETGWANVHGLASLKQTLNGCTALTALSLAGLDPSSLADLGFTFAGCANLVTIYADATWALPGSGVSGMGTFYNCSSLVGGNGTAYSSSAYGYARMVIDLAGQAGYQTAAS